MNVISQETPPVLSIEKLTLALPALADRAHAVEGVTLAIAPGETLCVVGESGSGKSMIAHAVMGLLPKAVKPAGGAIRLAGRDLLSLDEPAMQDVRGREIGMIFQEPMTSLNPVMRVADQIIETFEAHGLHGASERRARAVALLTEVGLPDPPRLAKAYPHELSGGQRQRVMIAMALALEPKLLIADEPTTALDVTTQAQILKLLDNLRHKHGTAVLFITHDMGVVAEIADRIAVLEKGVLVEEGTADQVLGAPRHAYTQKLLAAVPSLVPPMRPALPESPPVLSVEGLGKIYRKRSFFGTAREVRAAEDISFSLVRGETLGLVGESGSGKSTVGRCCLRLIEPNSGRIVLSGQGSGDLVLSDLGPTALRQHRKRIQMVFQDPFASLNPRQTVGRIISDGPVAHGVARVTALMKARELLELVGLSANAVDRYPHEFSGGQRQRIGIARALALEPDVLVADEAVSALDVSVQAQILSLIKDIQSRLGLAILFVTHDLRVAAQICDRIAVMQRGRIVETGPTAALFAAPQHEYTRQLLAAVPGGGRFGH
ncbi:ABC transporter ATP-binding protein [Bosea psychrotolerans]|uniref:Peptide/nickel transport system ATP-binding protein n=1 Tax=Bosea psychrotolerans TaxID=1871628 RepID=A0A2S4LYE9_9HYPH|nr:ABC transporter ATP-binding protein [Bosea psychrotolerans]POR47379.1 peptide/nickel transport system ATP-binding protein [Bosea psychrotolerans]